MGENSAGKPRSLSTSEAKLSRADIKKIIGIADKTRTKTADVESVNTEETIQGGIEKESCNEVFTPKNRIMRSPPDQQMKMDQQENNGKRLRSENNTPERENSHKRQCERQDSDVQETKQQQEGEIHSQELVTETLITEVFEALDTIQSAGEMDNKNKSLKMASNKMYKYVTILIHKIGKLEKDKLRLEYKVKDMSLKQHGNKTTGNDIQQRTKNNDDITRTELERNKTYAEISATDNTHTNNKMPRQEELIPWTTPKTAKKYETTITMETITDSRELLRHLTRNSNITDNFKRVLPLKSGAVLVESYDPKQQENLKQALKDREDIKIKDTLITEPMFMITGIHKGYQNEEFITELLRVNEDVEKELGNNVKDKITVVAKKQCRHPSKENWILQASPEIAKWFLKKQKINFDLVKAYVEEHINLAQCFKCSGFNHVAKYCKEEKLCCYKCGGDHQGIACQADSLTCPNCTKMKYAPDKSRHSARDVRCPVYKRKLIQHRSYVDYSNPPNFC